MALLGRGRGTDPQWITQEFAKAEDLAAVGQQERARDRYARLARRLASAPDDLQHYRGLALLGEAETILAMGIFTDAMARFREAYPLLTEPFRQLPRWLVRQFAEERMRAEDGDLKPVIDFLKAITYGLEPGDEDTAIRTVMWLQRACSTGPTVRREATARAALAALPGVDWPVLALTTMLRRDGRVKEAEDLLAAAVPGGSGELWFRWGIQLSTLLRYDDAIAAYDEAFRRGTGPASPWSRGAWLRPEALLFRGLAHQQMGRTDQAETDLRTASQYAPQDPRVHYSLGRLAVQLGQDDLAWNHFSNSLAVEAAFAPARLGLALLREQAGRPAEAIAHYQAALRHDAHSRAARIRLGAVLLAAGRRKEAQGLLEPESGQSTYWGGMATFHYGLAQLRANNPAGAIDTWDHLSSKDLRDWTAVARDREARKRLGSDPTAARLQWQIAYLDSPEVVEFRIALREAALREAAWMLMAGREIPDNREKAATALDLSASLPVANGADTLRGRQNRLRALVDLAGGTTTNLETFLDVEGRMRDRCHLAVAALLDGRFDEAETLLADLPEDPDCDPAVARARALYAERTGHWYDAVRWYQRFLDNDLDGTGSAADHADHAAETDHSGESEPFTVRDDDTQGLDIQEIANAGPLVAASRLAAEAEPDEADPPLPCVAVPDVECGKDAIGACAGCGRDGCATHLFRPAGRNSHRCERCAAPALQSLLYAARKAGVPDEAERTLSAWADAFGANPELTPPLRRQLALLRAEAGDLDGALAKLPADAETEGVELLIRRAAAAIERGEPYQALGDLRHALRIAPDQPQAAAALEALSEYAARQHADEGRHEEAFAGYLALVREDPTNPRLLHALGLSAYQLARTSGEDEYWTWAIGCMVTAMYAPEFWTRVVGVGDVEAEEERIARNRRALLDELRNDLRFADLSAYRGGDEVDAWTVRFGMDVLACQAEPAVSPTLDALLRQQPETPALARWRELADAKHAVDGEADGDADEESVRIAALYGPFGPQHFLYEDGRYEPAIAALDTVPEGERDQAWTALLRKALVMRGMELHLDEKWGPALECIARAASLDPDQKPDSVWVEIAAESGLNAARELLRRAEEGERPVSADATPTVNMAATSTPFIADATKTVNMAAVGLVARNADAASGGSRSGGGGAGAGGVAGAGVGAGIGPGGEGDVPAPVSLWQSVVDVLERALSVAPDVAELQAELGAAHMRRTGELRTDLRDYVLALSHARRAVDLLPDDPAAAALLEVVLAERAGSLTRPGPDGDLLEAVQWWQELGEMDPDKPEYHDGLSRALKLLACSAALGDRRSLAIDRMTWALLADQQWTGDAEAEAPRQIATLLIADAMDADRQRPFPDRAHRLRTALAYRDTKELRDLMVALWKNEASFQYETRHYGLCAALLEEALRLGDADPDATTTLMLSVPKTEDRQAAGMQPIHWHRYPRARALLKRTVDHFPDEDELRELHARSAAPEDPAST